MASPALQAKAQALNAKMEAAARAEIAEIENKTIRKIGRKGVECTLKCFDKAGTTGPSDVLQNCANQCQMPNQQAGQLLNAEVGQFQNRLSRSMMECQDKAKDLMYPGIENDAKKMGKVEDTMLACMSKTVDTHIGLLKPMRQRVESQLKQLG
ncbi:Protein FAM136A [Seminavis robusta]|uniref:Protein FAM136A n=1 Tax=Seminavis robusta TaxID=568900 RepID=A0A9N8DMN4_9STRA|nr:Protein FAM136A [Seminavis robusta]|eukprot:Sro163_g073090.1 Protein FAM136A (153) ;mRNA; f:19164-19622